MIEMAKIPPQARCLSCGYRLRGLPEAVCPECARAFDPLDPTTFDADPSGRRKRKWIVRGCVGLALVVLLFGLGPRRLLEGDLTFTCLHCTDKQTIRRWELVPPRWIPMRYPGIHWRSAHSGRSKSDTAGQCKEHLYGVSIRAEFRVGSVTGSTTPDVGEVPWINGQITTPQTAPDVLKSLMAPSNTGITIGAVPAPDDEAK